MPIQKEFAELVFGQKWQVLCPRHHVSTRLHLAAGCYRTVGFSANKAFRVFRILPPKAWASESFAPLTGVLSMATGVPSSSSHEAPSSRLSRGDKLVDRKPTPSPHSPARKKMRVALLQGKILCLQVKGRTTAKLYIENRCFSMAESLEMQPSLHC